MYNVKGPSKIVAKTTRRGGITQNIDPFRDHARNKPESSNYDENFANVPKPVFNNTSKKNAVCQKHQESISPEHEELVRYINDSWSSVCSEMKQNSPRSTNSQDSKSDQVISYYEDDPCPQLQDFKPFDLESWWGKRLYTYITNSVDTDC